jgi:hypothetical protein
VKGVLLILIPGILLVELPDGRNAVENKVIATERFMAGLKEIQKWSLEGESLPVAFVAQSDWDYESIISVATYFHSAGLKNSLILEVSSEFPANSTSISTFRVWSTEGVAGLYAPKNETSKDYVACIYSENIPKKKLEGCRDEIILKWLP